MINYGQVNHEDGILQLINTSKNKYFLTYEMQKDVPDFLDPDGTSLFSVYLTLDDKLISYTRQVYSVLDLLGDIGGLESSLTLVFGLLLSTYVDIKYSNSVINSFLTYIDKDLYSSKIEPKEETLNGS